MNFSEQTQIVVNEEFGGSWDAKQLLHRRYKSQQTLWRDLSKDPARGKAQGFSILLTDKSTHKLCRQGNVFFYLLKLFVSDNK